MGPENRLKQMRDGEQTGAPVADVAQASSSLQQAAA
jgi:hypothetical protein